MFIQSNKGLIFYTIAIFVVAFFATKAVDCSTHCKEKYSKCATKSAKHCPKDASAKVAWLSEELNLSDTQATQVAAVYEKKMKAKQALIEQKKQDMHAILTPEQQEKYETICAKGKRGCSKKEYDKKACKNKQK